MRNLGIVMDPIQAINYKKDSTLAMLWEAQDRGFKLHYLEQKDLYLRDGQAFGRARPLSVFRDANKWFVLGEGKAIPLREMDVILMRKDPPFNESYIYSTYILEHAERDGCLVINRAQSLRDANEKLFATYFPHCSPSTLVTQSISELQAFWITQGDIVCKPLNTMGGESIFRLRKDDVNANVIFETLTQNGKVYVMAQQFIPEIIAGDKRILLVNGNPIPHALARIPQGNDWRGNLAVGAKGRIQPLSDRDRFICAELGEALRQRGLYFVGIDIIGNFLTEINVTSPTGIRELDDALHINISAILFDCIEKLLKERTFIRPR